MNRILNVASLNPQKIKAVEELILEYSFLKNYKVLGLAVNTGVSEQPMSLEETVTGAINRAKSAFRNCEYSFGMESGMMSVPHTKSGIMDVCVCAIYDGKNIHLGLSSAFEPTVLVSKLMKEKGLDMTQASVEAGLTNDPNIGSSVGLIGILTHGRLNRLEYTKQAVMTALIHLENTEVFQE